MDVISKIDVIREQLNTYRKAGKKIGLVPTMGYFHQGHLSLMEIARQKCDVVVTSLFVNPTQFAPGEDFETYPKNLTRDQELAKNQGVDILFVPTEKLLYPEPFFTYVISEKLSKVLCGNKRTNHFRGVTTIVAKLFNIVQPDIAVFGQKDYQQAIIIQKMVEDLNFPIEIIVAPIVREKDGLAMSSRNTYLTKEQRKQAPVIFKALSRAQELFQSGETNAKIIHALINETIKSSSLAKIEYIEIVNAKNLKKDLNIIPGTFVAVAVYYGKTRLIDNLRFE